MNKPMAAPVKRWTAKRKTAPAFDIIEGRTTVAKAGQTYDLVPSEIESRIEEGRNTFKK